MKKRNLFLLLIMALFVVVPYNVKAITIPAAGMCNNATPNGTAEQICYINSGHNITLITDTNDNSYFCVQPNNDLADSEYAETQITYQNRGYACAVHNLLANGSVTIAELNAALTNGVFKFTRPTVSSPYTVTSLTGAANTYVKLQNEMWRIGANATCNPYVYNSSTSNNVLNPSISISSTPLTSNGTYYVSQINVTFAGMSSYNIQLANVTAGSFISTTQDASGKINDGVSGSLSASSFYLLIPVAEAEEASVRVTVSGNGVIKTVSATATEYEPTSPNRENNQRIARLAVSMSDTSKSATDTTIISLIPKIDFQICKKNSKTNAAMSGITFEVKSADNSVSFELQTGSDGCATKQNIPKAVYTVKEKATPAGFKKLAQEDVNCTTTVTGSVCKYEAENTPITLKVKKLDESGAALVDAKMEIWYLDGSATGTLIERWTTGITEDHVVNVETLQFGKYKLREQEAPAGYIIATEIDFEIKEDSYVIGNETKAYGDDAVVTVTMIDEATRFSVLKVDADTGKPLAGAVLQIEDEDGNIVQGPWTTTTEPKVFTKMAFGTYYLVEVSAPEGYEQQTERQQFTISATSQDTEVIIKNVPSTAAAKSALLISFAMLDIALGIAIILYVKKRQVTE